MTLYNHVQNQPSWVTEVIYNAYNDDLDDDSYCDEDDDDDNEHHYSNKRTESYRMNSLSSCNSMSSNNSNQCKFINLDLNFIF